MKIRTIVGLLIVAAATLTLGGCFLFLNNDPTVSLSSDVPATCYWGADLHFVAYAADQDNDTLKYEWYLNDVRQSAISDSVVWIPWDTDTGSNTIRVDVSDDWGGSATDEVTFTVYAGGWLRIQNRATSPNYTIGRVEIWRTGYSNTFDDHLNGDVILPGYDYDFPAPPYNSDLIAFSTGTRDWEDTNVVIITSTVTAVTLDNSNYHTFSIVPAPAGMKSSRSVSSGDKLFDDQKK